MTLVPVIAPVTKMALVCCHRSARESTARAAHPESSAECSSEDVGNYAQIFDRNLAPMGLHLEGSDNNLSSNGGLLSVPPYR
jgi:hypothetical protein